MKPFAFEGSIPASKSLMNRWLIIQSFANFGLQLNGFSNCTDVVDLNLALQQLKLADAFGDRRTLHCGDGGTTLRFLAFRVAREPGRFLLTGSNRLMQRPQQPLVETLQSLGVSCRWSSAGLEITGDGWQVPTTVHVGKNISSQFASGLLLSAWNLPKDLNITWEGNASESYLQMTIEVLRSAGMEIRETPTGVLVPAGQSVGVRSADVEPDMSSAFAIAAIAAVAGTAQFLNDMWDSRQPDFAFVETLARMGVSMQSSGTLRVSRAENLFSIEQDLSSTPDLLPVLSVLCAMANGTSRLTGIRNLQYKESDRVLNSMYLLRALGVECTRSDDALTIVGLNRMDFSLVQPIVFNPDQDHRMAMAAQLARWAGANITIENPEVVNKSFPEFWRWTQIH